MHTVRVMLTATAGALLAGATPGAAQRPERYTLSGDNVAVYNLAGVLRVEAGSAGDVVVEVTRGGADAAKLRIESGPLRSRSTLRVVYPDDRIVYPLMGHHTSTTLEVCDDGTFNDHEGRRHGGDGRRVRISDDGSGLEAHADVRVAIPAGRRVAVYLGVGKTTVTNVDGALRVDVAAADVTASQVKGSLIVDTGSGDVRLSDAEADVSLDTGSGNVTVSGVRGKELKVDTGSGDVSGERLEVDALKVETGSGDVDLAAVKSGEVSLNTGSGGVRLGLLSDVESLDVDTGSGNVTITVPPTLGAEVDIDTGSGEIDFSGVTLQVTHFERDHITGAIGDGRGRMKIETGSGDVKLQRSGSR